MKTHTKDVNGDTICLGDTVGYMGDTSIFEVVFEGNAFRKKYKDWNEHLEKPLLEYGHRAEVLQLIIIKRKLN